MLHRLFRVTLVSFFILGLNGQAFASQVLKSNLCDLRPLSGKITCITQLFGSRLDPKKIPLVIVHGANLQSIFFAEPRLEAWEPFVEFYSTDPQLKQNFEPYMFAYYSNMTTGEDLGTKLGQELDNLNASDSNFGSKPIVFDVHSFGNDITRSFMQKYVQRSGAWVGQIGGRRVAGMVSMGGAMWGSPMANGPALYARIKTTDELKLLLFENLFYYSGAGPTWDYPNRSDLRWGNHDGLLDYGKFPKERNLWLEGLNADHSFDSKIYAYAGVFDPKKDCDSFGASTMAYCLGSKILNNIDVASDGVVPVSSALLYDQNGRSRARKARLFEGYNHDDIVRGIGDGVLFNSVKNDLLEIASGIGSATIQSRTDILDFNGDGRGEVFGYNWNTGQWEIYFNDPNGYFRIQFGQWSPELTVKAADFNADGLTDLFLYNEINGDWAKAVNDGRGGFRYFSSKWSPGWQVNVADLDGDGRSDVFLYHVETGQWFKCVSLGDGTGEFTYSNGVWSPEWQVYTTEFNGDGRSDFFLYNGVSGQWFKVVNDGGRGFTYSSGFWSAGWQILPGDYSGDRLTDILLYNGWSGQWFLALNSGSGFDYRSGFWSPGWVVEPLDLDGNGMLDPFLYFQNSPEWFSVLNRRGGDFYYYGGRRTMIGSQFKAVDFNGDGWLDLLEYDSDSGTAMQWISKGSGDFQYRLNFMLPNRILLTKR